MPQAPTNLYLFPQAELRSASSRRVSAWYTIVSTTTASGILVVRRGVVCVWHLQGGPGILIPSPCHWQWPQAIALPVQCQWHPLALPVPVPVARTEHCQWHRDSQPASEPEAYYAPAASASAY